MVTDYTSVSLAPPPQRQPIRVEILRDEHGLTLTGRFHGEPMRARLIAALAALAPGLEVHDLTGINAARPGAGWGPELDIAALAAAGDGAALATMEAYEQRLARALAGVVNLLDPDLIVLGGGRSNLDHLHHRLPEAMRPHVFSDVFETRIVNNRLGDSAGVIGAAWLWPHELGPADSRLEGSP